MLPQILLALLCEITVMAPFAAFASAAIKRVPLKIARHAAALGADL
jgi:hypothetical protein